MGANKVRKLCPVKSSALQMGFRLKGSINYIQCLVNMEENWSVLSLGNVIEA